MKNDPIAEKVESIMRNCKRLELGCDDEYECMSCDITEELEKLGFERIAWSDIPCEENCAGNVQWEDHPFGRYWKQLDEEIWMRQIETETGWKVTHVLIINYIDITWVLLKHEADGELGE